MYGRQRSQYFKCGQLKVEEKNMNDYEISSQLLKEAREAIKKSKTGKDQIGEKIYDTHGILFGQKKKPMTTFDHLFERRGFCCDTFVVRTRKTKKLTEICDSAEINWVYFSRGRGAKPVRFFAPSTLQILKLYFRRL